MWIARNKGALAGLSLRRIVTIDMPFTLPLKKMSRNDKLRAMEALWADLSRDEAKLESPEWHVEALREAEQLVAQGKAKFSDWEEAKERIRRKASKQS